MLLGASLTFIALSLAVLLVRPPASGAGSLWAAFAGSLLMLVDIAWDSIRHVQGTGSELGPAMVYAGFFLVLIGIPAAVVARRNEGSGNIHSQ